MLNLSALMSLLDRYARTEGVHETAVPRLSLYRWSCATGPMYSAYEPCICVVAQGSKRVIAGECVHRYSARQYLVASVDIPIVGEVVEASDDAPFLALLLRLQPAVIHEMMNAGERDRATRDTPGPALGVSDIEPDLLGPCIRLIRLLESPDDIPVLAPLIEREIAYRLLQGTQASRISQIAFAGSRTKDINRAIAWIREHFHEPLHIEPLAELAYMSPSSLHHHFRTVTGMSPLQYQKHLRLQEARRLMVSEAANATLAGHAVGYESPSQFSREYRRMFGASPARDIAAIRNSEHRHSS